VHENVTVSITKTHVYQSHNAATSKTKTKWRGKERRKKEREKRESTKRKRVNAIFHIVFWQSISSASNSNKHCK